MMSSASSITQRFQRGSRHSRVGPRVFSKVVCAAHEQMGQRP